MDFIDTGDIKYYSNEKKKQKKNMKINPISLF